MELQHSNDGQHFEVIFQKTYQQPLYTFRHQPTIDKINYYRLKQTAANGQILYSKVIQFNKKEALINLQLFPSPASSKVRVQLPFIENIEGELFSNAGQKVLSFEFEEVTHFDLFLEAVSTGSYVLLVRSRKQVWKEQLIISH